MKEIVDRIMAWLAPIIQASLFFLVIVFVGYLFSLVIVSELTHAECLRYGWYDSAVTYNFERYCAREENEYEIVRPLEDIIQEGIIIEY